MLSQKERDILKQDGMSFEEIQDFEERLQSHKDGTALYIDHETFWKNVYGKINSKLEKKHV